MSIERILEFHKSQLNFHRILYGLLFIDLFIVYCMNIGNMSNLYLVALIGTILIIAAEAVLARKHYFNKMLVLQISSYIQYAFYLVMMFLIYNTSDVHTIMSLSVLIVTFMFEYTYFCDITDSFKTTQSIFILVGPAVVSLIVYFCINGVNTNGFLLFINYIMMVILSMLLVRLFFLNEHVLMRDNNILSSKIENMKNDNVELVSFKNKLEKVNEELNLQRVRLGQMNKEIQQSNNELAVQAELLKYINGALSKDVNSFINYIIDAIMRTRRVDFCGIYIDKNVFHNRNSVSAFRCVSNPELKRVPELLTLYEQITNNDNGLVIKNITPEYYPGLSQTDVRSILVLPLVLEEEKYGIMVVGAKQYALFDDHITFYDVIVPQFNMAIHNFKMYEQMKYIAQTDGLTGINNRTHFNRLFSEQMEKTVQNSDKLSVALFDIDKFKRINDTYGHLVGDEVIKRIAHLAAEYIEEKEVGFICRYGGEEFVIALPGMDENEALPIIQSLHSAIEHTTVEAYGHIVSMTVSIGLTSYPSLCDDINQLLKRADWAMYYSKEHGRNQIKVDGNDVTEVK